MEYYLLVLQRCFFIFVDTFLGKKNAPIITFIPDFWVNIVNKPHINIYIV